MPKVTQKGATTKREKARTETSTQGKPAKAGISPTRLLVFGDVVAFLAFAAIGRGTHNEPIGLAAIPEIVLTAAPFAIGWFIVAPFVGAFRPDLVQEPAAMAKRTALAWALSWPVALALRWLFVDRLRNTPASDFLSFALVTFVFVPAILLIWRWPFAINQRMKKG
jgi:hypothetical protein